VIESNILEIVKPFTYFHHPFLTLHHYPPLRPPFLFIQIHEKNSRISGNFSLYLGRNASEQEQQEQQEQQQKDSTKISGDGT